MKELYVVFRFLAVGQKGSRISQLRVRSLGVVERKIILRVGVCLIWVKEGEEFLTLSLKVVERKSGASAYSQILCVNIVTLERKIVKAVVESGIYLCKFLIVKIGIMLPGEDSGIDYAVWKDVCIQNSWRVGQYAVFCLAYAVSSHPSEFLGSKDLYVGNGICLVKRIYCCKNPLIQSHLS